MYDGHHILGLVPARGGSTGIPRKNLIDLAGRPLLAYTADAALASSVLDRVVLSTDDPEIAEAGRGVGLDVPFMRPSNLARSRTGMLEVVQHAIQEIGAVEGDAIVILQPTSPLRRAADIDACTRLLFDAGADAAVSVVEVPHQFTPGSVLQRDEHGFVQPYLPDPSVLRRQDKAMFYARNGPAVLAVRVEVAMAGSLYGTKCASWVMPKQRSVDVDDQPDLELVRLLVERDAGLG